MDQIEEIKAKIDLVQFISGYIPLQKAGRNFKAPCPFHTEKTPSFIVSPERQIWHCFGCQKGGDVFRFLMEYDRMDFGEALRLLAKKTGVVLKSYQPSEDEAQKEKLFQINHLAMEFFHYLLLNHQAAKPALEYILGRGISKDSLKLFKIGYSPHLWDGLQQYLVGKKGYRSQDLEAAGLIIPTSRISSPASRSQYYDRFRHRLMFPLIDHRGNVRGFAGRVLDPLVKEAKYVNTPETLVYHKSELLYPLDLTKEEIKKENQAVVVEGELDAISSFQIGIKNVVAIKGSALTEAQVKLLKRFTDNLVLALDADIAGDQAVRRGIEIADKEGLNIRVLELEKYKDPDEAAQKEPKYYRESLKKAVPYYDFLIDSSFKRNAGETPEGKRKIGEELIPPLSRIENEIVKDHYLRKLADKLGVSEEAIGIQIKKYLANQNLVKPALAPEKTNRSREEILEEYLLALCFQSGKIRPLSIEENRNLFQLPGYRKMIELLNPFFEKKFSSGEFAAVLPLELTDLFNNIYLVDLGKNNERVEDEDWLEKEIGQTLQQMKILKIKKDLVSVSEEIKKMEKEDRSGSNDWKEAENRFKDLSQQLASIKEEKRV